MIDLSMKYFNELCFSSNFSLHTLAWTSILQFKLSIILISLTSIFIISLLIEKGGTKGSKPVFQPCLYIFQ